MLSNYWQKLGILLTVLVIMITAILTVNAQTRDVSPFGEIRDVSASDPYYDALRNVVERYGLKVGYPDGTFQGNQFLKRREFVIYMNDALNQLEFPTAATGEANILADDVEEIATRLSNEHHSIEEELAQIKARLDQLERKAARN
jgi:porin